MRYNSLQIHLIRNVNKNLQSVLYTDVFNSKDTIETGDLLNKIQQVSQVR